MFGAEAPNDNCMLIECGMIESEENLNDWASANQSRRFAIMRRFGIGNGGNKPMRQH
jgi:hypothetical protein